MERLITAYFGEGYVLEWYEMGGTPYTCVVLTTNTHILTENYDKFMERPPLEETLKKHGYFLKDFNFIMTLHATEIVKTAVHRGLGISFLPYCSVKKEILQGTLKEIQVENFAESHPIYLVYLKEAEQNPRMKPLIQYLKQSKISEFC